MQKQPLIFMADGKLIQTDQFADDYPLKQTQALILTLEELSAWIKQARESFGESRHRALDSYHEWFDLTDNLIEEVYSAIEVDDDKDVIRCQLDADDPLVGTMEHVLWSCPNREEVIEGIRNKAIGNALGHLANFWVEQLRLRVIRLQSIAMGDGEVLSIIERQQTLAHIHF